MSLNFLDFEQPIAELEAKIDSLTAVSRQDEKLDINIDEEVHRLREKSVELTRKIFADLGAWQIAQLARHPQRPYTLDYVRLAFDEFDELAGDRAYADDKAIVGGIARLDGRPVMIIGHQKGRETKEKIRRNFGMPAPEGYRKALRLMQMAERFKMPIITFIDTPGAYPGFVGVLTHTNGDIFRLPQRIFKKPERHPHILHADIHRRVGVDEGIKREIFIKLIDIAT